MFIFLSSFCSHGLMQLQSFEWGAYHRSPFKGCIFRTGRFAIVWIFFYLSETKEKIIIKIKKTSHTFSLKYVPVQETENNSTCKKTQHLLLDFFFFYLNPNTTSATITTSTSSSSSPLIFTVRAHHRATQTPPRGGLRRSIRYFFIKRGVVGRGQSRGEEEKKKHTHTGRQTLMTGGLMCYRTRLRATTVTRRFARRGAARTDGVGGRNVIN